MKEKGITLIETVTSLAVFGVVVSIAINAFVSGLDAQRRNLVLQAAQNNLRYALEFMSREIRMSHVEIEDGRQQFLILTAFPDSENVFYSRSAGIPNQILRNSSPITSDEVDVKGLYFHISNSDNPPALVTVVVNAETTGAYAGQEINLQTTVSTRDYYVD